MLRVFYNRIINHLWIWVWYMYLANKRKTSWICWLRFKLCFFVTNINKRLKKTLIFHHHHLAPSSVLFVSITRLSTTRHVNDCQIYHKTTAHRHRKSLCLEIIAAASSLRAKTGSDWAHRKMKKKKNHVIRFPSHLVC